MPNGQWIVYIIEGRNVKKSLPLTLVIACETDIDERDY